MHSSSLYHTFDKVLLLSRGRTLYFGDGGLEPARYFAERGVSGAEKCLGGALQTSVARSGTIRSNNHTAPRQEGDRNNIQSGYNVADFLLDIASEYVPESELGDGHDLSPAPSSSNPAEKGNMLAPRSRTVKGESFSTPFYSVTYIKCIKFAGSGQRRKFPFLSDLKVSRQEYATTFLTQFEVLAGREWKILCRCVAWPICADRLFPCLSGTNSDLHPQRQDCFFDPCCCCFRAWSVLWGPVLPNGNNDCRVSVSRWMSIFLGSFDSILKLKCTV